MWAQHEEADVTGATLELHSWDETQSLLSCLPLPIMADAALIRVGSYDCALRELLDALLTHSEFPLGTLLNASSGMKR